MTDLSGIFEQGAFSGFASALGRNGMDFTPITEHVRAKVAAAVKDVLERIEVSYITTIPANRSRSHRFTGMRIGRSGRQGRAGIFFPSRIRFDPQDTDTQRYAQTAWRRVGRECERLLTTAVADAIKTAPQCFKITIGG